MPQTNLTNARKESTDRHTRDPKQVEWLHSFYQIFRDLSELVKQHFPNGIPWNPKGEPAQVVAKALASPAASPAPVAGSGAPPPPAPAPAGGDRKSVV